MNKSELITPSEVDELNEARCLLDRIAERVRFTNASDETRLLLRADDAQAAIFDLLVVARVYLDSPISDAVLYNRREADQVQA